MRSGAVAFFLVACFFPPLQRVAVCYTVSPRESVPVCAVSVTGEASAEKKQQLFLVPVAEDCTGHCGVMQCSLVSSTPTADQNGSEASEAERKRGAVTRVTDPVVVRACAGARIT